MAFDGTLIKVGGSSGTALPLKYIALGSYKITPDQMLDLDSGRDTTGVLHRTVLSHSASKIEFETIDHITNAEWNSLWATISGAFTDSSARKLSVYYYDTLTDGYKTATCYVPDVTLEIDHVKGTTIYYAPIRVAFIEY